MAKQNMQATADGRLVLSDNPPHPTLERRVAILEQALAAQGWNPQVQSADEGSRLIRIDISKGDKKYFLRVYVFPNLGFANRTNLAEKRIQLNRDYSEHESDFLIENRGEDKCLLLGMYFNDGQEIICAWDARAYRGHSNPSSCYVKAGAIADAMRCGFGQSIDGKARLVCCFKPEFLSYYIENMADLHDRVVVNPEILERSLDGEPVEDDPSGVARPELPPQDALMPYPRNRIIYGAPGTGKSFKLASDVKNSFPHPFLFERVTFHPEYSYSQFVGSYRPVPLYSKASTPFYGADKITPTDEFEPTIDYQYVPGPFLRMLVRALQNQDAKFVLIIEEINRANAPAVFGDAFQLLDRDAGGVGQFEIHLPIEAAAYLRSVGQSDALRMPRNLYLWATMNSADQGVLPLDSAFKRRWSFEYVSLEDGANVVDDWDMKLNFLSSGIRWNIFRRAVNNALRNHEVPEDRLLGPFFMSKDDLDSNDAFKNKLLLYLRDDVVRHNPEVLFQGESLGYGALVEAYDSGKPIFVDGVMQAFEGS